MTIFTSRNVSRLGALTALGMIIVVLGLAAAFATSHESGGDAHHGAHAVTFLWIALILLFARFAGLIERFGLPSVLGELLVGIALGNLGLVGITFFEAITHDSIIGFLAELGVVILLFQIGLESNIKQFREVGGKALMVAIVGVVAPFVLGTYLLGPWLLGNESFETHLFIGAALTATSVGITARVFQDLGKLKTPEAAIVLGAAVFDDVLGLIILAIVSAIVAVGSISLGTVGLIAGKAFLFLVGAVIIGQLLAPRLGKLFSRVHSGNGMKLTLALAFGLIVAWLANSIGLAAIIGAFAAGLVLDPIHFKHFKSPRFAEKVRHLHGDLKKKDKHSRALGDVAREADHHHIEELIEPIGHLLVPIFFVTTGMSVQLSSLFSQQVLMIGVAVVVVAIIGKVVAGYAAGKGVNRAVIGWAMVPRGEVGLVFASIGAGLGVVSPEVFSILILMVVVTTLISPIMLTRLLNK